MVTADDGGIRRQEQQAPRRDDDPCASQDAAMGEREIGNQVVGSGGLGLGRERGHRQSRGGWNGGWIAGDTFCQECGQANFFEHV